MRLKWKGRKRQRPSRKFTHPYSSPIASPTANPFACPLFAEVREQFHGDHDINAPVQLTRRVIDPETMPVPEPFQTPTWRPALSLAFRSRAQSAAPSASDWSDINSALFQ